MTIASQTSRISYNGDGSTTAFAVPFNFQVNADLVVYLQDAAGNQTLQSLGTNYTLSGAGVASGGTCTFATAPASGYLVTVYRDPPVTQTTSYNNNDPFPAKSHENALDKLTMLIQRVRDLVTRSLRLPDGEGNTSTILAPIAVRKNKMFGFDTNGAMIYPLGPSFVSIYAIGTAPVDSRATAQITTFAASTNTIRTDGYGSPGDGGGALYKRVASQPSHAGKFQSADGAWWEIASPSLNQYMFGAVGNGTADDTAALQAMIDFSELTGTPYRALNGLHKTTTTLKIKQSGDLRDCVIFTNAATVSPAVRVGEQSSTATTYSKTIYLPKVVNSGKFAPASNATGFAATMTGWAPFLYAIGVECATAYNSMIYVNEIYGFGIGFTGGGYANAGFTDNHVFLKLLLDNRINFQLKAGADSGFANENLIYGGRFTHDSTEGSLISGCYDIWIGEASPTSTNGQPNNNVFIKPNVESNTPLISIHVQGAYNKFINARFDGNPKNVEFYSRPALPGETSRNVFDGGYNIETVAWYEYGVCSENTISHPSFRSIDAGTNAGALVISNKVGDGSAHVTGYPAAVSVIDKLRAPTSEWTYQITAQKLSGKRTGDSGIRAQLDFNAGALVLSDGAGGTLQLGFLSIGTMYTDAHFVPSTDNTRALGTTSNRWSQLCAATSTINTSDAREKDWRGGLNAAELRVAIRLSKLIGLYRWKDAIEKKGDEARLHAGVLAQDVQAAFAAEGLDGFGYGVLCHDVWEARTAELDKDGKVVTPAIEAGERYGLRYDELWAFVAAGFETRLAVLENAA